MDPIFDELQMEALSPIDQAKTAISHTLNKIKDDPYVAYYIGVGSQTYALLTEAAATLWDRPVKEVRQKFLNRDARNPKND